MAINEFPIGQTLLGVSTIADQEFGGDELCLDEVKLYFEDPEHKITLVTLSPIVDTDEIEVTIEKTTNLHAADSVGNNQLVCSLPLGTKLMNVWVCENAQGYQDQVILAFDSLHPLITFMAEGSVIKVFLNEKILKDKKLKSFNQRLIESQIEMIVKLPIIKDDPEMLKIFTDMIKDENSVEGEKVDTFMKHQQSHQIMDNPDSNVVMSAQSYQKLIDRIKELEDMVSIQTDMR
ncbi:DUF6334 family protein [Sphaerospermopsis torques-reginae]|uniref:Uncharacterized protein n=1 Tax=Sphaerospermopsis torques-reginae ITEP-024 TaxID=984208 RepID=A0ABX8WYT1_9CYAN|nr:DUF6334 family protein [Sphaerospermopsis torques-reginae]QYX31510.1 hypothetical protein K2F26_22355 [Sphaerospermopsis torques-reginae ITEP-024]